MKTISLLVTGVVALASAAPARAQTPHDSARAVQDSALRVFLDCPGFVPGCDFDYFRTEITFVNYVRDRQDGEVHVLITSQTTGGGGHEYTLAFIGLKRFAGTADTLRHVSSNTATEDERRKALAQTIRLGLVRFAAKTPLAPQIQVTYTASPQAAARVRDPWNYWVFRISMNGYAQGEKLVRFVNIFGNVSATRVTEAWKLSFRTNESYNQSDYTLINTDSLNRVDTQTVTSITRSYNGNALIVRSVGGHWSAGVRASAFSSTFFNQALTLRAGPALEYNIWPYSQSTRRLLTLQYAIDVLTADYEDTTIYNKTAETLFSQSLTASIDVKQPWGSVSLFLVGSHYLQDFKKNRLVLGGGGQYRLFKGLSVNASGNVSLIHDQLFLRKGSASDQDVLLRRRELETSYRFFIFGGLSYTFGSKFANVVNPRFESGGGGFFFID